MPLSIEIKSLKFSYDPSHPLIDIEHWQLESNAQMFLYGSSGSGKSTLLNLLCGILLPQRGCINLLGQPFSQMKSRQRDAFRARHIGVIFQEFNLIPYLTVWENIEVAIYFSQKSILLNESKYRAKEIFERLKLDEKILSQRADSLSVGQRQRVSIARALINQPKILIADEPTSALDADNRDEFMQLLLENSLQSGCSVLFVSHDKSLQRHFSQHHDIAELFDKEETCVIENR